MPRPEDQPPEGAEALRDQCAAELRVELRDRARDASPKIDTMLRVLADRLFDPDLNVRAWRQAAGVRDNSIPVRFHRDLGISPHRLLTRCRLRVAQRLLDESDLTVGKIAELIGFGSIQAFSRAFLRVTGLRPTHYRDRAGHPAEGEASARSGDELSTRGPTIDDPAYLAASASGDLDPGEARRLISRLVSIYLLRSFGRE